MSCSRCSQLTPNLTFPLLFHRLLLLQCPLSGNDGSPSLQSSFTLIFLSGQWQLEESNILSTESVLRDATNVVSPSFWQVLEELLENSVWKWPSSFCCSESNSADGRNIPFLTIPRPVLKNMNWMSGVSYRAGTGKGLFENMRSQIPFFCLHTPFIHKVFSWHLAAQHT